MVGVGGAGRPFPDDGGAERKRKPLLVGLSVVVAAVVAVAGARMVAASEGAGLVVVASKEAGALQPEGGDAVIGEGGGMRAPGGSAGSVDGTGGVPDASGEDGSAAESAPPQSDGALFVHIGGYVASPGVYELPAGSRLSDAVGIAGGFAEGAAPDALNLARILTDGERVIVPSAEEYVRAGGGASGEPETDAGEATAGVQGSVPSGSAAQAGKVNINAASAEELESLPGIGPATAQKIVSSRQSEGPFQTCEDLMRVSGIGQKKYDGLADRICVG